MAEAAAKRKCHSCSCTSGSGKSREQFSEEQWNLPTEQRKCLQCFELYTKHPHLNLFDSAGNPRRQKGSRINYVQRYYLEVNSSRQGNGVDDDVKPVVLVTCLRPSDFNLFRIALSPQDRLGYASSYRTYLEQLSRSVSHSSNEMVCIVQSSDVIGAIRWCREQGLDCTPHNMNNEYLHQELVKRVEREHALGRMYPPGHLHFKYFTIDTTVPRQYRMHCYNLDGGDNGEGCQRREGNEETFSKCAKCHCAYYCCEACQVADFPKHKKWCIKKI